MADINARANVVLSVNGKEAQRVLDDSRKKAEQLAKAIDQAKKSGDSVSLKKLESEYKSVQRTIQQIEAAAKTTADVMRRLDSATPKELNAVLRQLKKELNNIERGTAAWDAQTEKIRRIQAEINKCNESMKVQLSLTQRLADGFNRFFGVIGGAAAALTGAVAAGKKAVSMYAEMDEAMANTRKFTGMSVEQVRELNEEFKKMDTRTGREQLNALAQEAGRLGKTTQEDVMGYVKAADIINVALSDLGDGATQKIAKLSNIFKIEDQYGTYDSMLKIGSVINVLSQNCTASKPYLVEFTNRLAGVGNQANLTVQQIVGMGAALDANAQKVESSATAISQVLTRMFVYPSKYARVAGLDVQKFTELLKTDANEALLQFLTALNKAGNMDALAPMFKEMGEGGQRAIAAMSTLAKHIDEVRWQQENANKAFEEGTSVLNEFNIFNNTAQATLDKAKKNFQELAIQLGEKLMPVMRYFYSGSSMTLRALNSIVSFIIEYKSAIVTLTAAIVAYTVAVKAAVVAMALKRAAILTANAAVKVYRTTVLLLNSALALATGNVTKATVQFKLFSAALRANPAGLVAAGITMLATALALWNNRNKDAAEKQKALNKIHDDAAVKVEKEKSKIETLIKAANNVNLAYDLRKRAIEELNRIIPGYNASLDEETGKYRANKDALDEYLISLQKKFEIEGAESQLKDIGNKKAEVKVKMQSNTMELESLDRDNKPYNAAPINTPMWGAVEVVDEVENRRRHLRHENELYEKELRRLAELETSINEIYGGDIVEKQLQAVEEENNNENAFGHSDTKNSTGRFEEEKLWKEREEALALSAKAWARIFDESGKEVLFTHADYLDRMEAIEVEYYERILQHTDLSEQERIVMQSKYDEALAKQRGTAYAQSVEEEEQFYKKWLAMWDQYYIDGLISRETYEQKYEEEEIEHLRRLVNIEDQSVEDRIKAEKKLTEATTKEAIKRRKQVEEEAKKQSKADSETKSQYFGDNADEKKQKYDDEIKQLDRVYNQELEKVRGNKAEELRLEEAYQMAKVMIAKKYNQQYADDASSTYKDAINKSIEWLNSDGGKALTGTMSMLVSGMGEIFSGISQMMQADLEIQTAAIEKRYDREISLAQGNSYKVAQAEKKKEAELAKAKNEANKKQFNMQIIQAVAQTAQNAVNAYGSAAAIPVVGYVMAPIAAAMAVAAGMIQIAAIKKQAAAAEATGYAEGGFTKPGDKFEPAGIVHAGEWVASQELVNSPVTRPVIDALEYAQRNNRISSLRPDDISRTITAPATLARIAEDDTTGVATASAIALMSKVVNRLNNRLDEPIAAITTIAGDYGINKNQAEYATLLRNKSNKRRYADNN